jgi:hypothetical protein
MGSIGALPRGSETLRLTGVRDLGLYAEGRYLLISAGACARLRQGEAPAAWNVAMAEAGRPAIPAERLRAISALASDPAQVLVALPPELDPVLRAPGCRAQWLRPAEGSQGAGRTDAATRRPSPPETPPGRDQAPEFWQALSDAACSDHVLSDLDSLSTVLQTRYYSTPQLDVACRSVKARFEALGLTASFDPFTYNGRPLNNVLAIQPGTEDPSRIYVIVGHLDSISPDPQHQAPGADDNGSGSVAVLEAARLLSRLPARYTIYYLCVSAEEEGLVGSEHFAAWADQQNLDIEGVLNLDMVSWFDPAGADLWIEGFHQGVSSTWLMDLVQGNAETYAGLSVYIYPGEGFGSDHVPFHSHGYPAILSIENEWDGYPCYHRTCDTVDEVNPLFWRDITAANAVSLAQLAGLQGSLGGIDGSVSTADGGNAAGVTLTLSGTRCPARLSGLNGAFGWNGLYPAVYTLIAGKTGYLPDTVAVAVPNGGLAEVHLNLQPSGSSAVGPLPPGRIGQEAIGRGPVALALSPNPSSAGFSVLLRLPRPETGRLSVYRVDGRIVATLIPWGLGPAGERKLFWNGRDERGRELPAGAYRIGWQGRSGAASSFGIIVR